MPPASHQTFGTPVATGQASASDPAVYEQLVKPWDLFLSPKENGNLRYAMRYLKVPGVTVYRETFSLRCNLQGLSPANTLVLALPIKKSHHSTFWGSALDGASSLPVMLPGGLDVQLEREHDQLIVLFDLNEIEAALPPTTYATLEKAATTHFLPIEERDLNVFRAQLTRLLSISNDLTEPPVTQAVSRMVKESVVHLLANVDDSAANYPKPAASLRHKGLQSALAYLRHTDPSTLTIGDLSRAAGVSQRTLEYAFRDNFGITPLAFLRLKRMHAARQDLSFASGESETVTRVAMRHGFFHSGRFAQCYQRMFGEAPSTTLKRMTGESGGDRPLGPDRPLLF